MPTYKCKECKHFNKKNIECTKYEKVFNNGYELDSHQKTFCDSPEKK